MNVYELIERAKSLLEDLPQTPWEVMRLEMLNATMNNTADMDFEMRTRISTLIESAPDLIKELVEAVLFLSERAI